MEWVDDDIRGRVEKIIITKGLSQRTFAFMVGVNPANLNQVMLGNRPVQKNLPGKIISKFPDISIDWLLYGDGEMYKNDNESTDNELALKDPVCGVKARRFQDEERRKRICRLMDLEGLSQRGFADRIGYSYSSLNKIMIGVRFVPSTLPSKIAEAFPEVRIDWLLYGEGEMYKSEQHLVEQKALLEHAELLPTRPRLPKSMSEGHVEQYFEGAKRELCQEKPRIIQFADYDFSLILKNNRMSPKYERGDELFFKKALFPEWGNDFLLDTDDGPKFKRIYQEWTTDKDDNKVELVRCVSYNKEEFPDFTIERSLVHNFYRCVGVLRIL